MSGAALGFRDFGSNSGGVPPLHAAARHDDDAATVQEKRRERERAFADPSARGCFCPVDAVTKDRERNDFVVLGQGRLQANARVPSDKRCRPKLSRCDENDDLAPGPVRRNLIVRMVSYLRRKIKKIYTAAHNVSRALDPFHNAEPCCSIRFAFCLYGGQGSVGQLHRMTAKTIKAAVGSSQSQPASVITKPTITTPAETAESSAMRRSAPRIRHVVKPVPEGIDAVAVRACLERLPGVSEVHDLHICPMSTTKTALSANLVMPKGFSGDQFLLCSGRASRDRLPYPPSRDRHDTLRFGPFER